MAPPVSRAALRHPSIAAARTPRAAQLRSVGTRIPPPPPRPSRRFGRGTVLGLSAAAVAGAAAVTFYPALSGRPETVEIPKARIEFERKRPKTRTAKGDASGLPQVQKSRETPGVYAWGSNAGRVVAPDSDESVVKTPRRIPYFDGKVLRDLKLDRDFGAAVTEGGDLVQWGTGYSAASPGPEVTLKGKDIVKLALSRDRVLALSSGGSVYSVPAAKADQESGEKPSESSWLPFWSGSSPISYRPLKLGEKVVDIKSGLEHALLLTSHGRVFSSASCSTDFPSRGQMGIPGLTWQTRPQGPYDQPHEVEALRGRKVKQIAAGDYHSVVLDGEGRAYSFGDNSTGQLGFPVEASSPVVETPSPLPLGNLYKGTGLLPSITSIAAGGGNSYFTVDAAKPAEGDASGRGKDSVVAETWACGEGIHGSLGTGKWTHISNSPTKIKALSSLSEWDEKARRVVPIRLARLSVGSTHAAAVLDNAAYLDAAGNGADADTRLGSDVLVWGGNEHHQLGTGRRNNASVPTHMAPLDGPVDAKGVPLAPAAGEGQRLQVAPRRTVRLDGGKGRKVSVEQRVECGRLVSAVYSAA